jgi:hypothetical protein
MAKTWRRFKKFGLWGPFLFEKALNCCNQGVYIIRWDFDEDFMFQRAKINLKCITYWSCYMGVNSK